MNRQELYKKLVQAKRPFDIFGEVEDLSGLKKKYLSFAKIIHPDTAKDFEQYISTLGFSILGELYTRGQSELSEGIYGVVEPEEIYKHQNSLFDLTVHNKKYSFYEHIYSGEVADIYRGLYENESVILKVCIDESDNDLLKIEFDTLDTISHPSLPIVREYIKVNGCSGIIMDERKGVNLSNIIEKNPNGIDAEIVAWMLERLFSVVGYLHSNKIVHGNIIPENIVVTPENHNVSLMGFSFHIPDAQNEDKKYQIFNDDYSDPMIKKGIKVNPKTDIYSIGKIMIKLLGGNLSNNGLPIKIDSRVRTFIRKLVSDYNVRSDDAWGLWDEWRKIRLEVYGKPHFTVVNF